MSEHKEQLMNGNFIDTNRGKVSRSHKPKSSSDAGLIADTDVENLSNLGIQLEILFLDGRLTIDILVNKKQST